MSDRSPNAGGDLATPHCYSQTWFSTFSDSIEPAQTAHEAAFLERHLPRPPYQSVIDLCCGAGRHARALAEHGYRVTGLDNNPEVISRARVGAPGVDFRVHDMQHLEESTLDADALIMLWQSFGHFSAAANLDVLRQVRGVLREHGRFILDIYNRRFFEAHQGTRTFNRGGRTGSETKTMRGKRLTVRLEYEGLETTDTFSWQLYDSEEIVEHMQDQGFEEVVSCCGFDESIPPDDALPRMQFVFEKI